MIQVQRFNKVLKLAVILGDLVILNVLFISFNSIWNELFGERACSGTLPQILTLFSVCYFACTISGGVILHRRGARADQIVFRVLRNVFYFSFLSTGLMVLSELEIYSKRFFIYYFILLILCITVYRLLFRFCIQLYRSHGGNFRTVLYLGSTENIAELYHEMTSDACNYCNYYTDYNACHASVLEEQEDKSEQEYVFIPVRNLKHCKCCS